MKTSVRNQLRDRNGKAAVRRTLNRRDRRQARMDIHEGYLPRRTRHSLDYVLV